MHLQIIAAKSLRELSIEKRKCRFKDENEKMEFLNDYTLDGCEYECALRNARQKCHCAPWNYPRLDSGCTVEASEWDQFEPIPK